MRFSRIAPWIASLFIIPTASFGPHFAAIAQYGVGVRSVFSSQAQGLKGGSAPNITVWPGTGMNISFIPVNENILKVWLDDPSRITVDFDRPLCDAVTGSPTSGDSCSEPSAQVVHLRQVRGITFPNLPTASSTLLSVVTVDQRRQRRLYHFYVDTASGAPEYSALIVTPDEGIRDTSQLTIRGGRKVDIETVSVGLRYAEIKGRIGPAQGNEALKARVLNFIALVRNGSEFSDAAGQAGVSLALITKLAELGLESETRSVPPPTPIPIPIDPVPGVPEASPVPSQDETPPIELFSEPEPEISVNL